jgi:hypothetical protein
MRGSRASPGDSRTPPGYGEHSSHSSGEKHFLKAVYLHCVKGDERRLISPSLV